MKPARATALAVVVLGALLNGASTSVADRFAFFPDRKFALRDEQLPPEVRRLSIKTGDGETLEAFFVQRTASDRLAIYFHGNGGNISQRVPELIRLAATGVNVFGVGYRGYGASTGRPGARGIYRDGEAALNTAVQTLGFPVERIFLCGRSLGTFVAVRVAADRPLAGLVLITPPTTGADVARAHGATLVAWAAGGDFDNLAHLARLRAPVLVIHGTADEVIPFAQGQKIFDQLGVPKRLVRIDAGRHNDLEQREPARYAKELRQFFATPGDVAWKN